ncbi:MAG: mechanosensitive ion channel family protein [Thermoproteota archaeon]|jgi:2,3-bisphosphoglycerate-dependent phosphoglycerate mutase|nr:mechanosensitive ion channel family protein [Thermoproteota archaeon]
MISITLSDFWNYIIQYQGVIEAVIAIIIAVIIAKYLTVMIRRRLHEKVPSHIISNINKLVYYIIILIGIAVAIRLLNIPGLTLTELLVAGGFTAIVIGLAAQQTLSNFFAGILLMTERPFKIGDYINYNNNIGMVVDIGLLSTKIQSWEGYYIRIPNSELFNSPLINYSNSVARLVRVQFVIPYEYDVNKVIETLIKEFEAQWYVLAEPAPSVFVAQFDEKGILMEARAWTAGKTWFDLYSNMPRIIEETLKKLGMPYSYPKRILFISKKDITEDQPLK